MANSTHARAEALEAGLWPLDIASSNVEASKTESRLWDSNTTDEELMLACQRGRADALDALYQRYYRQVFLFVLRMMQNRELAEDIVQETFLRVYCNRDSWQPRSKFTSWMYRIARNLCIDEKRRYWNRLIQADSQIFDSNGENNQSFLDRVEDSGNNAHSHYVAKINEEAIKKAINQLSDEQREVIIMNKYQGMSYIEIAEALGATPESIKQRAYRAHLKLRQLLKPMLGEYA